jgi:hypothetical protein
MRLPPDIGRPPADYDARTQSHIVVTADPCSDDLAQFETAIRQSAGAPDAGLMAPQSVAVQRQLPADGPFDEDSGAWSESEMCSGDGASQTA